MFRIIAISALCAVFGGCIHTNSNHADDPIVSPTVITNEANDKEDPILPPYTPWWVKE